jgi:hypothetical protein
MPFDNSPNPVLLDEPMAPVAKNTLAALGLHPIAREEAELHKAKMIADFVAKNSHNRYMVQNHIAFWREIEVTNLEKTLSRPPVYSSVENRGAPAEVIELARSVRQNLPEAEFQMEYFYTDPILNVTYNDAAGVKHRDCLAIWDKGEVIALASGEIKTRWRFGVHFLRAVLLEAAIAIVMLLSVVVVGGAFF